MPHRKEGSLVDSDELQKLGEKASDLHLNSGIPLSDAVVKVARWHGRLNHARASQPATNNGMSTRKQQHNSSSVTSISTYFKKKSRVLGPYIMNLGLRSVYHCMIFLNSSSKTDLEHDALEHGR